MKILVIFTGGTIGSEASGEYISIDGIKPYKLLQMYADAYPDEARDVRFDTESPYTVLSENADGNTFKKLFDAVSQGVDAGYDGIIVTHGKIRNRCLCGIRQQRRQMQDSLRARTDAAQNV